MKKILMIFISALMIMNLQAQEAKTKQERRAEKKAKDIARRDSLRVVQEMWVQNKTYVLEAQQVYNKMGEMFQLSPSTNFVYVDGDEAIVQLSFNGLSGWNGVGGITIKGKISKYSYESDNKNKPIFIRMTIQGNSGFHDISMWISNSGSGEASIVDIKGNRIKFTGETVALNRSAIYIGTER